MAGLRINTLFVTNETMAGLRINTQFVFWGFSTCVAGKAGFPRLRRSQQQQQIGAWRVQEPRDVVYRLQKSEFERSRRLQIRL